MSPIEREPVYGATTSLAGACSHPVRIAQVRSRSNFIGRKRYPRQLRGAWPVTATLVGLAPATAIGGALVEHAGWEWCFVAAALTALTGVAVVLLRGTLTLEAAVAAS